MKVTHPIIHLNGTAATELRGQFHRVVEALRETDVALCHASPHQRDYYVSQEGVAYWQRARAEFESRRQRIAELQQEMYALYEGTFE
jgi:hypothetical protein